MVLHGAMVLEARRPVPFRTASQSNHQHNGDTKMTPTIDQLDLEDAAKEAVGNWMHFDCFSWHHSSEIEDADQFCLVYTHNRDSGLVDQSNAEAIAEAMKPFLDRDVLEEHDRHWAVGWVSGYAIRVYRRGRVTKAFRTWHELQSRLADYSLLDEDDYFSRYYEATIENIGQAAWRVKRTYDLPTGWEVRVYHWLADHDLSEIEDHDDRGGYPSEDALRRAFHALGYKRTEEE